MTAETNTSKWNDKFMALVETTLDKSEAMVRLLLPEKDASLERHTLVTLHAVCMARLIAEAGSPMTREEMMALYELASSFVEAREKVKSHAGNC